MRKMIYLRIVMGSNWDYSTLPQMGIRIIDWLQGISIPEREIPMTKIKKKRYA